MLKRINVGRRCRRICYAGGGRGDTCRRVLTSERVDVEARLVNWRRVREERIETCGRVVETDGT